jgi:predicted DNA-binding transcriptional regulator YafY
MELDMAGNASISNKTYRVIALLQALPRSPHKITSNEIHQRLTSEGHDITRRSIERYLKELSESQAFGALVQCDDKAMPYGWSVAQKQNLSIPGMDAQMAATWDLVARYLTPLMAKDVLDKLEPVFNEARKWFERHRPMGKRYWSDKVAYVPRGFHLEPARVSAGIADQVYDALYRNRQMNIWYKDKDEPHLVHPYALVDRGAVRYLVVRFWNYKDYRHLALHRLRKVHVLDDEVEGASTFDLDTYLQEGNMNLPYGDSINLVMRLYGRAADHLYETPVNETQTLKEIEPDVTELRVQVQNTEELRWWVLGLGANVEVVKPVKLRNQIKLELGRGFERYA